MTDYNALALSMSISVATQMKAHGKIIAIRAIGRTFNLVKELSLLKFYIPTIAMKEEN